MRLIVETDETRVVALDSLEQYLSPATGGVAIGNVGSVLNAIRLAASAINPPTYTPTQLEQMTDLVFSAAANIKALIGKVAADDPDAVAALELLRALGLESPPVVTDPPTPLAPVNVTPPAVTGTPRAAQVLSTTNGTWTGQEPITFAYRWQRCDSAGTNCSPVVLLAQAQTYTVKSADVGSTLRVAVTASNGSGTAQALSDATAVVTT